MTPPASARTHTFIHTAECLCGTFNSFTSSLMDEGKGSTEQATRRPPSACITTSLRGRGAAGSNCCDCNQASPDNYHNRLITGLGDQTRLLQRPAVPTALRILACVCVYLSVSLSEVQTAADSGGGVVCVGGGERKKPGKIII